MYISSYPTHVRMERWENGKIHALGSHEVKIVYENSRHFHRRLCHQKPTLYEKSARLSYHPHPSQFQKTHHEHWKWMAHHTTFFFLYVTRKYVGLGEQMHRASKNTGSWMEWAFFFVGDMERENIVVTMEWEWVAF